MAIGLGLHRELPLWTITPFEREVRLVRRDFEDHLQADAVFYILLDVASGGWCISSTQGHQ